MTVESDGVEITERVVLCKVYRLVAEMNEQKLRGGGGEGGEGERLNLPQLQLLFYTSGVRA